MYLGIDLGTSSMKCLLLGEKQEILFSVNSEDIPLSTPQNGWSEQDPSFWTKALDPVSYTHLTLPTSHNV